MGGLLVVAVVIAIGLLVELSGSDFVDSSTFAPMATLALVGILGTADDFLNARTGDGISASQKLLWQSVVAGVAAWQIQDTYQITALFVPFFGALTIPPWLYILIAAFAIVATSNAVNITDGLDGLAGGTLIFAFIGYMVIAVVRFPAGATAAADLPLLCALIIGALLAFLWFNVHPAQVFMGDSGALSLGATLAVIALITGQVLLLPLIGLIFVLETMADILQIASVKLRGKRLFLMAPLHHHFELKGWDEEKITLRFWIVGALSALVGVAFFLATRGMLRERGSMTACPGLDLGDPGPRLVRRAAGGGAGPGPQRHRAGALPRRRGAEVTVYDGQPAEALREAVAALGERPSEPPAWARRRPALALRGQALICTSPSVSSRFPTTEPRLRAALAAVEAEGACRSSARSTSSCGSARRRPSASPAPRARRRPRR